MVYARDNWSDTTAINSGAYGKMIGFGCMLASACVSLGTVTWIIRLLADRGVLL